MIEKVVDIVAVWKAPRWSLVWKVTIMVSLLAVIDSASWDASARARFPALKFGLHYAGPHNGKAHTCAMTFETFQCWIPGAKPDEFVVDAPDSAGSYDIYVIALCVVDGVAGARYGMSCSGRLYFYGWTRCSDFEIPSAGWPGCGEGNAQTWSTVQTATHVGLGLLQVYSYGEPSRLCLGADPRVGYAEFCDGSEPTPHCMKVTSEWDFSCVGFGQEGYNACPCGADPVRNNTWGAVKALYR